MHHAVRLSIKIKSKAIKSWKQQQQKNLTWNPASGPDWALGMYGGGASASIDGFGGKFTSFSPKDAASTAFSDIFVRKYRNECFHAGSPPEMVCLP